MDNFKLNTNPQPGTPIKAFNPEVVAARIQNLEKPDPFDLALSIMIATDDSGTETINIAWGNGRVSQVKVTPEMELERIWRSRGERCDQSESMEVFGVIPGLSLLLEALGYGSDIQIRVTETEGCLFADLFVPALTEVS